MLYETKFYKLISIKKDRIPTSTKFFTNLQHIYSNSVRYVAMLFLEILVMTVSPKYNTNGTNPSRILTYYMIPTYE